MEPNSFYQYSLAGALMDGVADGWLSISEACMHGDHGLGTFEDLNGEMVMVDGEIFRVTCDGRVSKEGRESLLSFAQITKFTPSITREVASLDDTLLKAELNKSHANSSNLFVSIRIDGFFSEVNTHIVNKQEYPGQTGLEILKTIKKPVLSNVSGTAFGFRSPRYTGGGLSVPGVHLHFVSADRKCGGHVTDFKMKEGAVASSVMSYMRLQLPTTETFNKARLGPS